MPVHREIRPAVGVFDERNRFAPGRIVVGHCPAEGDFGTKLRGVRQSRAQGSELGLSNVRGLRIRYAIVKWHIVLRGLQVRREAAHSRTTIGVRLSSNEEYIDGLAFRAGEKQARERGNKQRRLRFQNSLGVRKDAWASTAFPEGFRSDFVKIESGFAAGPKSIYLVSHANEF